MYKYYLSGHFLKQVKELQKQYRHIKEDLIIALKNFDQRQADSLGHSVYKLRCKSADIKKGKSKSLRLIIFIYRAKLALLPIVVYFKGDKGDISKKEILYHLAQVLSEVKKLMRI